MSRAETILGFLLALGGAVLIWRLAEADATRTGRARRLALFVKVFLRAVFALAPFVAIAFVLTTTLIPRVVGTEDLSAAFGALVTGAIVAVGWIASATASEYRQALDEDRQEGERETMRRDTLIALRSEIVTFVEVLDRTDIVGSGHDVVRNIRRGLDGDGRKTAEYHPFSTTESDPVIFHAVSGNVPSLPADVVEVVVRFYAQLTDLKAVVMDTRSSEARGLSRERRVNLHAILVRRRLEVLHRGLAAIVAINRALGIDAPLVRSGRNHAVGPDGSGVSFETDAGRART